ncbi:MAG: cupin domain-containing protein [bacterium]
MSRFSVNEQDVKALNLPGRDWKMLIDHKMGCRNICFGIAEFPPYEKPDAHVHAAEEEIIYILSGKGIMEMDGEIINLLPGVAVYMPPGKEHRVENTGDETLKLITLFSPPVVPGSYDPKEA